MLQKIEIIELHANYCVVHTMSFKGKEEEDTEARFVWVTPSSVMVTIDNYQRLTDDFQHVFTKVGLPCSSNRLQYGVGENIGTIFGKCSSQFKTHHPFPEENPRVFLDKAPDCQEIISLTFVRDVRQPLDEDHETESIDDISEFSDDDEDYVSDDYDY